MDCLHFWSFKCTQHCFWAAWREELRKPHGSNDGWIEKWDVQKKNKIRWTRSKKRYAVNRPFGLLG